MITESIKLDLRITALAEVSDPAVDCCALAVVMKEKLFTGENLRSILPPKTGFCVCVLSIFGYVLKKTK